MSKDNDKSLKKLNAQIAKLSKEKEKNEKTPVIKKNDLLIYCMNLKNFIESLCL